eukprot:tig00001128_g7190.t3
MIRETVTDAKKAAQVVRKLTTAIGEQAHKTWAARCQAYAEWEKACGITKVMKERRAKAKRTEARGREADAPPDDTAGNARRKRADPEPRQRERCRECDRAVPPTAPVSGFFADPRLLAVDRPLAALATHLYMSGLAASTRRSYSYPQREFIEFCLQRGLHDRQGSVLPASETTLCFFAAHLFRRGGVAPPSIRTYITAVQSLHVDSGFSTFWGAMPRLARLLEGIARVADPRPKLRRDPITRGQLSALAQYAAAHPSPETRLLWAAFATAFFGFFRCSEVCAVRLPVPDPARLFQRRDLRFFVDEGERFARLRLKKSKSDQRGQGCDVDIPHVGGPECAHCALEALAASWTGPARPDAYVFAHADSSQPLTRSELHAALRNWLRALGYAADPLLPHSFRIGAATAAFEAGLPDYAIQLLGRWRSDAFQLYIRARPELVRRQRGLLLTGGSTPPAT